MLNADTLQPGAPVTIADEITVPCAYLAPMRWNGFAVPYFDRDQVDALMAALTAYDTAHGGQSGLELLRWGTDGQTVQRWSPESEPGIEAEPLADGDETEGDPEDTAFRIWRAFATPSIVADGTPDGLTVWAVGDGWTWDSHTAYASLEDVRWSFPVYGLEPEVHGLAIAWVPRWVAERRVADLAGVSTSDGRMIESVADLEALPKRPGLYGIRARWTEEEA